MKKAVILDTSAIMYRTHFALMGMRNSKGLATGATYGFVNTLEGVLKEFSPDYLVACLDIKRSELKRSEELETYKAHRESMPDDLVAQQEYIMSVLEGYKIPKYKIDGYEADDVMATLATKFSEDTDEEIEVYIVTGDKDLAQLVNGKINIALLGKGDKKSSLFKYIRTDEDVIEYLGVTPDKIPDLFGLMGDSSDGIPGVSGIGPKTGVELINKYGNLEGLYEHIDEIKGKRKEKLIEDKENAFLSRKLATVYKDIEIEYDKNKLKLENTNLHFRVNMKDKLSDKMVVKHNTISGTGGTIYVKNSGSTDTTGREKVVLIEAKKGVDSGVKFRLANNVEIGAYEYVLDNSLVGSGREYYLIGEKAHIIPDVPSNVKNDVPALSKPSMKTQKGVSGNSINSKNYTAELTQGNINLTNSTLWVEQGRGLKLKNTPINIKNSSMVINTKDTNSGVKIDAETSTGAILKVERTSANANANHRDLFVNGTFKVIGNKTTPNAITLGKNTVTQIYNPKGDTALDLRNTSMKIEDGAKLYLDGKRALNSKNSNISGKGVFHIKGDMIHEGDNGVNLTLENGSFIESSSIQFDESNVGSSLRFKSGSELRISNLSNAKMTFDKGSRVFLYTSNQEAEEIKNGDANKSIDQVINGITLGNNANTVTLTGVVEMNDVDIYTRVNLKDNLGDHIVVDGDKGLLKGTGATLHLRNTGSLEVDNISRSVRFFTGKLADGFVWKVAHPLEVGAYVYDTTLSQTKDDKGITRVTFNLKEQRRRQAKLTSTAKGFMENTYADYFQELGTVDDVFKGMSNIEFTKKDSVWAKVGGTTLETKEGFKSNAKSVYVGFDRQIGQIEDLHAGIFLGNTSASKKYDIYSGDGKSQIFHGGAYLSYRSMLGDGDFILKYSKGKTEYGVLDTVGDKISNKYDYSSKMAAFRFGKKLYPFSKENLYIEPAIQVSYGEIDNVNSTASNGLNTKIKTIRTWTTGGDVKLGFKTNALNTYVKAGVSKEFLGDTDFLFNTSGDERRQVDKGIATFGAGLEYHIGDHSISLEIVRKESNLLKDFYQASIGYQYKF